MSDKETETAPAIKLLCVDDEKNILVSLKRLFRREGYEIFLAESGAEGLEVVENEAIDIIISDMRMPNMDGAEFLRRAKEINKNIPSILLTGFSDQESTIRAVNEGKISGYVSKPWEDNDLKLKVASLLKISQLEKEKERLLLLTHQQNKKLLNWNKQLEDKVQQRVLELKQTEGMLDQAYKELSESYDAVVKLLSHAICARENMLNRQYPMLATLCEKLAEMADLSSYMVKQVYYAGLLFELGKLALPDQLLNTPLELLSPEELDRHNSYPQIGADVLKRISNFQDTARIIEHHLEYVNGSGSPDGLKKEDIPIGCRILSIVKDYFLLQSGNLDGIKYTARDARNYLLNIKAKLYDESLVAKFYDVAKYYESENEISEEMLLNSKKLLKGMVLSRDCINAKGLLLLQQGMILTDEMIARLIAFEKIYDSPLQIYVLK